MLSTLQQLRGGPGWQQAPHPLRTLTPEALTRHLDAFHAGNLRAAVLLWDAIERRDDVLQGVAAKRKKSISRLQWDILTTDESEEALAQQESLRFFYNSLRCVNAANGNERGGFSLLIKQMMDAVGKRYAVHEIVYQTHENCRLHDSGQPLLSAEFRFVPLEFFENRTGKLRFLLRDGDREGVELEEGSWLTTVGDGLMEACSIAYLFKHLPLRDWLVYCERNGMPGVKGVTDALPGTPQWEMAKRAVEAFGAEFNALMSTGSDLQAIDLSARGELPYPALVDRMDRAMAALWCGSDLSTFSRANGVGASMQADERSLLESDDAAMVSETLNVQVDRHVLGHLFGGSPVRAYVRLRPSQHRNVLQEIEVYERLARLGLEIPKKDLRERFGVGLTGENDECVATGKSANE
jgi:phage gp29-like protein